MDEAGRKKLCARVNANMQMNEHILEEQTHIWKLIIQHADFFFTCGDALFYHILFYARSIAIRSYSNRELLVDVISLVAAFYTRKQKSHVPTSEEYQSQLHINTHMLKQSWQWAVNGRLLDMHAEFFVEIAVVGDEYGSGSEEEE